MANMQVTVVDGNNVTVSLDRGVAGVGIASVQLVVINQANYLLITYTNGTTQTVGPVGVIQYNATTPINISGSTISLLTVPVNLGGTGQTTANAGFNALAPSQASASGKYLKTDGTNSAWDALDISTADITGTLPIVNGGTGQTTANSGLNALLPAQASQANKYLQTDGTNSSWDAISLSTADITGVLPVVNGGTGVGTSTGTGNTVLSTSPTLVTPVLGTPASGTLTNATGLPVATGISGLGTGIATFLATPSSANLAAALTDETGTGAAVFATSPTLVTPALGTPASGVMTNVTGTAAGLTAGNVTTNANLTGMVTSVGNATTVVTNANLTGGVTSVGNAATVITNANLTGDITSVGNATTLTNAPVIAKVLTGYISGAGTVAATDSILQAIQKLDGNNSTNANLTGPITSVGNVTSIASQTGTGTKFVVDTSPTLITPDLGTPSALIGTNITGTATSFTASNVTTNANLTGDVTSIGNATAIAAGVIVNADINASAAIDDTKLATISTASKVSNSATTAASANTASAIVARDASGNFTAGTVTAALTGNSSTATALATGRTIEITGDLAYISPSFDGTGNVTAAGTLATVATAGVTGSSTAIPVVTINAKGLTTSITTAAVIAPAGTLSGSTLAAGVTGSSLTSLGTIANLSVTAGTISTTPSASTDIANKDYVDNVAQGLDPKASCVAATTANITLSGTQTIDGVALIAADRCLVKDQTAPAENGIYVVAAGAWARSADMNVWLEVPGAFTFIEQGTLYADTGWVCTSNAGGTLGTTAITFVQFAGAGSYTASTGLTLTGTAFSLTAPVTVALGGTNSTSAGIASFNNITGYTAAGATGTTSTNLVFSTSPTLVTPDLGTPSALVGTNITGTATSFTSSNVTTNANLTGAVTSVGNATSLGSFTSANLATALIDETGTGVAVFSTNPILVTPNLGTPTTLVLTSATGLPLTTGVTGTLPVANGGTGVTTSTGTTNVVLSNSPTLVAPVLGTPASATLTNATGLPISTGVSGLGTGVVTALGVNTGTAGAFVVNGGVLGTPSSGTLTNATGLPISTGVSGLGTGIATALAVNVGTAGSPVVNGGALGTPSSGTVTNLTGTASININGTVGATTATTGAFTTVTATGSIQGQASNAFKTNSNSGQYYHFDNATGNNFIGLSSTNTVQLYAGSALSSTFTAAGLAVTGTLSATGATTLATTSVFGGPGTAAGLTALTVGDATNATFRMAFTNAPLIQVATNTSVTLAFGAKESSAGAFTQWAALSSTGLAVTGTLSATGTLSGGTSGTGYSFSGSAPATSLTLDSSGNLLVGNTTQSGTANRVAVFSANKFGLSVIDTTAQATGVGGALNLGGNYRTTGDAQAFARVSAVKQNSTDNDYGYGMAFSTTPNGGTFVEAGRFDSSGNLGIGTTLPAAKLEVVAGTGSQALTVFRTGDGTAANNAGGGFSATSSATAGSRNARLWLDADGANFSGSDYFYIDKIGNSGEVALIQQSAAAMTFQTSGTERARIDSAGVFQAGTIQASGTAVGSFSASKWFIQSEDSTTTRAYYTGPDASTKGSWEIYAATSTGSAVLAGRFNASANFVAQNIGLGATIPTTSGTGITFPATQSASSDANTLDDYEEGTWTPADNSGAGLSFTVYDATYTKIGRLVEIEAAIYFPSTASTALVSFSGLPFTSAGGNDNTGGLSITATNVGANYTALITRNATTFSVNTNLDVGVSNAIYSSKMLKFFGVYHV